MRETCSSLIIVERWDYCRGARERKRLFLYRVILVVLELGWVDLDLRCSPGWWAVTAATYCQGSIVEHRKSQST